MSVVVRSQYRVPKDLNDWLVSRATDEVRSKNAQLVFELRVRMQAATESQSTDQSTRVASSNR